MRLSRLLLVLSMCAAAPAAAEPIYRGMSFLGDMLPTAKLQKMASTGANIVRLEYADWNAYTDGPEQYRAWVDYTLVNLAEHLAEAQRLGMKAVIMIGAPGERERSMSPARDRVFLPGWEWTADLYVETWQRVAEIANGNPTVVGYHIMSEPGTPKAAEWQALAQRISQAIRSTGDTPVDQQPMILLSPIYGNVDLISSIGKPTAGGRYGIAVSYYGPLAYVGQGDTNDLTITYPGCAELPRGQRNIKVTNKSTAKQMLQSAKHRRPGRRHRRPRPTPTPKPTPLPRGITLINRCSPEGLRYLVRKVDVFSRRQQLPVFVTEYSVAGWAPGAAAYLRDVTGMFDAFGWSSFYLGFESVPIFNPWYGGTRDNWTLSPETTDRLQVLEEYFSRNQT